MSLQINSWQSHNSKKATTGTEIDSFALLSTYEKIERESFLLFFLNSWGYIHDPVVHAKPSSCELPVGHHSLTMIINLATFPIQRQSFPTTLPGLPVLQPSTLIFCPVALTNIIQLFLYPWTKSSKISLSWTITFVTLIFPLSPLIFSPLVWSEPEAPPEHFPTSQSSFHSSCSSDLTQNQSPFSIFTLCTGCAKYKSHPVLSPPQNSPARCSLRPHILIPVSHRWEVLYYKPPNTCW